MLRELARHAPVPQQRQLLGRRGLDGLAAIEQRGEEAGAVAPGVQAVAAGEDDDQGQVPAFADAGQHETVALQQGRGRDLPVPDLVVVGRIGSRQVVDELGPEALEDPGQVLPQGRQVGRVLHVVTELDHRLRHRLDASRGEVVDREEMDVGIVGEDRARAVAVVHVEVHDEDPEFGAAGAQVGDGRGHVVVDAEALAPGGKGVVETAAEVDGDAPPSRARRVASSVPPAMERCDSSIRSATSSGTEADDARQGARPVQGVQVVVGVDAPEVAEGGRLGPVDGGSVEEAGGVEEAEDALAAARIVRAPGQVELVAPAVDEPHGGRPDQPGEPAPAAAEVPDRDRESRPGSRRIAGGPRWRPSRPPPWERRRNPRPGGRARAGSAPSAAARRPPSVDDPEIPEALLVGGVEIVADDVRDLRRAEAVEVQDVGDRQLDGLGLPGSVVFVVLHCG